LVVKPKVINILDTGLARTKPTPAVAHTHGTQPIETMTDTRTVNPRLSINEKGVYEIRWTENSRSRRHSTNTSVPSEAQAFFARWLMSRDEQHRKSADPTVADILDMYMGGHVREKVVAQDRQEDAVKVLKDGLGHLRPRDVSAAALAKYKSARSSGAINGRKVGVGTIRRELNCLVAACNYARKQRVIPPDAVPFVELPPAPPPKDLWLKEEELFEFLKQADMADDELRLFVYMAAHTASRRGAVMKLTWGQVDFERSVIDFENDGCLRTKKRRVQVPMTAGVAKLLREAKAKQGDPLPTYRVLHGSFDLYRKFKSLCSAVAERTGNDKFLAVTPHTLRHTWATLAAKNRVPMFEIAGVLGDTMATVERVYAKHHPDHLRRAVGFMDGLGVSP